MELDLDPFDGDDSLGLNDVLDGIGNAVESIVDFVVPDGLFTFDPSDYASTSGEAPAAGPGLSGVSGIPSDATMPPELTYDGFHQSPPDVAGGWVEQHLNHLLGNVQTVDGMVDEVVADIEAQAPPDPTGGLFPHGMPGGSVTNDVLGFINSGGATISDLADTALSGEDLSAEQLAAGQDLIESNTALTGLFDVMTWDNQIIEDVDSQQQRIDHGNVWQETNGRVWHWNNHTGRWDRVHLDPHHGTPVYSPSPVEDPWVEPRFPDNF